MVQVSELRSGTTFLNFGAPHPNQVFYAVVFSSRRALFSDLRSLEGRVVRVEGRVREYRGRPQIVLESAGQLEVVAERSPPAGAAAGMLGSAWLVAPRAPSIHFEGGAGQVSGSLAVLSLDSGRYLVDAGAFYGEEAHPSEPRRDAVDPRSLALPIPARAVSAIFVTHAHADHIGRLPLAQREGFRGKIYLTAATARLAEQALATAIRYEPGRVRSWVWSSAPSRSSAEKVHWVADCPWAGRIAPKNRRDFRGHYRELESKLREQGAGAASPCRVCADLEARDVIEMFERIEFDRPVTVAHDLTAIARAAGHIPGATSYLFRARSGGREQAIAFSGDLGGSTSPFVEAPQPVPAAEVLVVETTYGREVGSRPKPESTSRAAFRRDLSAAVRSGKVAWIPAFALDRTQQVLVEIGDLLNGSMSLRGGRVCVVSPEGLGFTATYLDPDFNGFLKLGAQARIFSGFETQFKSATCRIVISSSGMLDLGMSSRLLPELAGRAEVEIFLVGFQAPGTPGGDLMECARGGVSPCSVRTRRNGADERAAVQGKVRKYDGFSAHARPAEIDEWLSKQDRSKAQILLVHGDAEALETRRVDLLAKGWKHVHVPRAGESWWLPENAAQ